MNRLISSARVLSCSFLALLLAALAPGVMAFNLEASHDFSGGYAGGSGWSGPWTETGDSAGAGGGDIFISGGELQFEGAGFPNNGFIVRELDVSDLASEAGLILFFDVRLIGGIEDTDVLEVFASADGGTNWTEIRQFNGQAAFEGTGATGRSIILDISEFISAQTAVRFGIKNVSVGPSGGFTGGGEGILFDNVEIYSTPASLSLETDEFFGGLALPTATGGGAAQIFDATNQPYSDDGAILSFGPSPSGANPNGPLMIFDTGAPTGGDTDLGAPNGDSNSNGNNCAENAGISSTPGVGGDVDGDGLADGALGQAGENCRPLGNSLIISEDADAFDPDDDGVGGSFIFDFDAPIDFGALELIDDLDGEITLTFDDGSSETVDLTDVQDFIGQGENGVFFVSFKDFVRSTDVKQISVSLTSSGTVITVFGEAPGQDLGDAPDSYSTLLASGGPSHRIEPDGRPLHFGTAPDSEADGAPSPGADGDDAPASLASPATVADYDDEDAITTFPVGCPGGVGDGCAPGETYSLDLAVTNQIGQAALACGWIDFNRDGDFDNQDAVDDGDDGGQDNNEERACVLVPSGLVGGTVTLDFVIPDDFENVDSTVETYVTRFRITTDWSSSADATPTGPASDGEIEDFLMDGETGVPVTLASFSSTLSNGVITAQWSTSSELANVGFMLYGEDARGNWRPLLSEMQLSPVMDSEGPQRYTARVSARRIQRLFLEDTDVYGKTTLHGPFDVGRQFGHEPIVAPIDWDRIRQASPTLSRSTTGPVVGLPQRPVRLLVESEGIHRVSYEELARAGLISGRIEAQNLQLTLNGEDVPIRLVGTTRLEPGGEIEFLGLPIDSQYSRETVYELGVVYGHSRNGGRVQSNGASRSNRNPVQPNQGQRPVAGITEGRAQLQLGRDRRYSASSVAETPWADTRMVVQSAERSWNFPLNLEAMIAGGSVLELYLAGVTDFPDTDLDHHVIVSVNGVEVETLRFAGRQTRRLSIGLPDGLLQNGSNQLTLTMPADTGAPASVVNLVDYGIDYPRALIMSSAPLKFDALGPTLQVEGLSVPEVSVYQRRAGQTQWVDGVSIGKGDRYTAMIPGAPAMATYYVATPDQILRPELEPGRARISLVATPADYLMVSHPDFIDTLQPLVDFHQARGLTVRVVDVQDIYAQYGYGQTDPQAIADYLRQAAPRMGLRYVLLVGGDTWDYRNSAQTNSVSFIPSLYTRTGSLVQFAPSDSLLADLDGDTIQDLAIGRFPVRTPAELSAVIAKTLQFADRDYAESLVLSADRQEPGLSFTDQSEQVFGKLEGDWSVTRAYLDESSLLDARSNLIAGVDQGASLTAFFGHSSYSVWSFEGLFETSDINWLSNAERPTSVVQFGCWNTYHVLPSYDTLGHGFLLTPDRGAALVMGSATFTQVTSSRAFASVLIPELLEPGQSAGWAVVEAKRQIAISQPQALDMIRGWTILGDPAIELGRP